MKILQVNKYFYLRGGTERYLFDVSELLEHRGHKIVPFAMSDHKNDPTPYAKYFSPHQKTETVRFSLEGAKTALDTIYNFEAKKRIAHLIRDTGPQVAHIHNIYHQLSSSVLDALRAAKIPTVMTVHDYRLLSPNYTLFHDGLICERGIRNAWGVVPHRCLKKSFAASAAAAFETSLTRFRKSYERTISRFLVPSRAALGLFNRAGFDMRKFVFLPHFLEARKYHPNFTPGNEVVYVGRLSPEKGVDVLIEAASLLPEIKFKIIGAGSEESKLRAQAEGLKNVEFVGWLIDSELHHAISSAAVVVVPSIWYEVFGYSALEAMALGKPVLASRIGALPEIVRDRITGRLFSPGNQNELAETLREMLKDTATLEKMGHSAREVVEREYGAERHFAGLMEAYSDALGK